MLFWILFLISFIVAALSGIRMGINFSTSIIFTILNFVPLLAGSALLTAILTLVLPDGPKVLREQQYCPVVDMDEDTVVYETEQGTYIEFPRNDFEVRYDAQYMPYIEHLSYKQGGFKGYWLLDLNDYPDKYILHLKGEE